MTQSDTLYFFLGALVVLMAWGLQRLSNQFPPDSEKEGPPLLPLFIAQGFGSGQIPKAPGTFGSVIGLGWFALLVWAANWPVYIAGMLLSFPISVQLCGLAEKTMGEKDPGAVVLDEVAAVPVCFIAWVLIETFNSGQMPGPGYFFSSSNWLLTLGIFVLFRFFDIMKPWPVRQSQLLPGGLGITVDDFLAAGYVNLITVAVYVGQRVWS